MLHRRAAVVPSFLQEDPRLQQALNALTRDSLASVVLGSPPMRGEKAGYIRVCYHGLSRVSQSCGNSHCGHRSQPANNQLDTASEEIGTVFLP